VGEVYPYMPPVNFKQTQRQNNATLCGARVYLMQLVISAADRARKRLRSRPVPSGDCIYFSLSATTVIYFSTDTVNIIIL
jgi:hypothetical protein